MSGLYEVVAVKDRFVHGAFETFKAEDGYVVHRSFIRAKNEEDAIDQVKSFHITPGKKYDSIRAEFVQDR